MKEIGGNVGQFGACLLHVRQRGLMGPTSKQKTHVFTRGEDLTEVMNTCV